MTQPETQTVTIASITEPMTFEGVTLEQAKQIYDKGLDLLETEDFSKKPDAEIMAVVENTVQALAPRYRIRSRTRKAT